MEEKIIYTDEYIKITSISNDVFIQSFKKGLTFDPLELILQNHPYIHVSEFTILKNSISLAPKPALKFGNIKERISLTLSSDKLTAFIQFNIPKEDLSTENRPNLIKEILEKLKLLSIIFGVKKEFLYDNFEDGKQYVIAEGTSVIHGTDCILKMYSLEEPTPEIRDDGKINFYELKLINRVHAGDWLGERINATDGSYGKTVLGETLNPIKGKNFPLLYDKNTVYEVDEGYKITLYAKIDGAVNYCDGKIGISNHLNIDGDVDFKTGNINFDGYVTINGTIADGFSVDATKDIEINSPLGLGSIKHVKSSQGSIYIKGGIASKNKVEIYAENNIFTKFVDNVNIVCQGILNLGFYCINSTIHASEVFIESTKGSISASTVKATYKVTCSSIGSNIERRTIIDISGFDRNELTLRLESINTEMENLKNDQQKFKQLLASNNVPPNSLLPIFLRMNEIKEQIKSLETEKKSTNRFLKTKGEGEIQATKKIYPNCLFILKGIHMEIQQEQPAISYYYLDGEVKSTS